MQVNLGYLVALLFDGIRQRSPWAHNTLRLVVWISNLISCAVEAMPTAALALDVLLRLASFTRQATNGLWRLRVLVIELDVVHVQMQLTILVLADLHPLILALVDLLEVNDVVASWTVAVGIEIEFVAGEAFELDISEIFQQLGAFCWAHRFA